MTLLKRRREDLKDALKNIPEDVKKLSDAVLIRDKQRQKCRIIHSKSEDANEKSIDVPEYFTEVIGWMDGKDLVRVRKTPKC